MAIIIILNIAIIIFIYFKYYYLDQNIKFSQEKIQELSPTVIGYINNKGFANNYDLILAEILELNQKGYLTIEYVKEDISEYNYTIKQNFDKDTERLKKYELIVMNFLFEKKSEISREELEEKLEITFNSYNTEYNQLGKFAKEELIEQNFIEEEETNKIRKFAKSYIKISEILIIMLFVLKIFIFKQITILHIQIYILEKIISSMMLLRATKYTDKGIALKNGVKEYREQLQNKEFLVDKEKMSEVIYEKEFINSIALHINTQAKAAFINEQIIKDAMKIIKKVIIKIIIGIILFFPTCAIIVSISKGLTIGAFFWIYIIMAIILAGIADAAKLIATDKKKK